MNLTGGSEKNGNLISGYLGTLIWHSRVPPFWVEVGCMPILGESRVYAPLLVIKGICPSLGHSTKIF